MTNAMMKTKISQLPYIRPAISVFASGVIVLQPTTPVPEVIVDPGTEGGGALSKETDFDLWQEEEEEAPARPFTFD